MSIEYALRMYPPRQKKHKDIARADSLIGNSLYILRVKILYSGKYPAVQPGNSEQMNTSEQVITGGGGVAIRGR